MTRAPSTTVRTTNVRKPVPPSLASSALASVPIVIDALAPVAADTLFAPASRHHPAKVCVIAEIGVNHDGKVDRAIELVHAAARSGADAVKTQLFDPRHLLSNQARLAVYQEGKAGPENEVFAMLDRLMLDADELLAVRAAARRLGLLFIVTPFSLENFETLQALDVDAVKTASPDAVNGPLLELTASLGRPMIVSTGTAELDELDFAAQLIHRQPPSRGVRGCLLQCVSSYPTPEAGAALGAMNAMARRFDLPVGYSDHTTEIATGALAVASGACVIEKHLTYDKTAPGPDHSASFTPFEFAQYVRGIRQAAAMLGPLNKRVLDVERDVRSVSRQSLCAVRDLPVGHVLTRRDITVKRPGTGIPAARLTAVLGRKLRRGVSGNSLIQDDDLVV